MKTVKYEVTFGEPANRLELFVRIVWAIPSYIVMVVLGIILYICLALQWLHILILGKRHKLLHDWIVKALTYDFKWMSYFCLATEERNPLLPES